MGNLKERAKALFSPRSSSFRSTTSLGKRTSDERPEVSRSCLFSMPRKHRESEAIFRYGDLVHYAPEVVQGRIQEYWIAGRHYDSENETWRYFLRDGEKPDGDEWGWAGEAALRRVGQEGITMDSPTGGYEVFKGGIGGLGVI